MPSIFDRKRSDLIRSYEGFEPEAYQLRGEDFSNTIGYGSTSYEDGSAVGPNDRISEERAQELDLHIQRTRDPVSKLRATKKLAA